MAAQQGRGLFLARRFQSALRRHISHRHRDRARFHPGAGMGDGYRPVIILNTIVNAGHRHRLRPPVRGREGQRGGRDRRRVLIIADDQGSPSPPPPVRRQAPRYKSPACLSVTVTASGVNTSADERTVTAADVTPVRVSDVPPPSSNVTFTAIHLPSSAATSV